VRRHWRTPTRRELTPAMLRFLAVGNTSESSAEDGHLHPFLLSGRVHDYLRWPATYPHLREAVDEVRTLYEAHRAEIDAAAEVLTRGRYLAYARAIIARADEIARESKRGDNNNGNS
jgi:hypothetical protein